MMNEQLKKDLDKAIEIYNKYYPESTFETKINPMHPFQFNRLSNVKGFNKVNGYTYYEYVEIWKKRYEKIN